MRIALVDDCPNDLSIMHQFLAEALDTDSVITEFHNGEDFLQHWSADTFDLIVLDIYMEQLTGIEIARVIRETDPNVCLVFATTNDIIPCHFTFNFDKHFFLSMSCNAM